MKCEGIVEVGRGNRSTVGCGSWKFWENGEEVSVGHQYAISVLNVVVEPCVIFVENRNIYRRMKFCKKTEINRVIINP
jgi:hypothetical protein